MRFGGLEIFALLALVLLFYGPKQLPKLADAFNKSKRIVKENNVDKADVSEGSKEESVNANE